MRNRIALGRDIIGALKRSINRMPPYPLAVSPPMNLTGAHDVDGSLDSLVSMTAAADHWEINDAGMSLGELETTFEHVTRNKALKRLVFYRPCGEVCVTGRLNVERLVSALRGTFSVRSLSLANMCLGEVDLERIAETLADKRFSIESLNLSSNRISDAGVGTIAKTLHVNTSLKSLDLESNSFGDEGASHLARALEVNTTLCELDINANHVHLDLGYRDLGGALRTNRACVEVRLDAEIAQTPYWQSVVQSQKRYISRRLVAYTLMKGAPKAFIGVATIEGGKLDFASVSIMGRVASFLIGPSQRSRGSRGGGGDSREDDDGDDGEEENVAGGGTRSRFRLRPARAGGAADA